MSFRDDLGAAHARSEALERRVAELEAENRRLRGDPEPEAEPAIKADRGLRGATLPLFLAAAALAAGAAIAVFVDQPALAAVLAMLALLVSLQTAVLSRLLYVAPPNVALVISGRPHLRGGVQRSYRVVIGGRAVRIPILERIDVLDLRDRRIEASISGAYCKGGARVSLSLAAGVHIARTEPRIDNAIERFLGRDFDEIARVARETLEGHAREVVSELTPEMIELDREKLAHEIIAEAESSFDKLGLELDSLAVLEVARS